MSLVTNVILNYGPLAPFFLKERVSHKEATRRALEMVNDFFGDATGFVDVDDPALPRGWYGGSKMFEVDIAIGALNHLNLVAFIEHLRDIPWRNPENVQLMVNLQDDRHFKLINVFAPTSYGETP